MHFVVISVFHVLCIHVVEFFNFVSYFIGKAQMKHFKTEGMVFDNRKDGS